MMITSKYTSSCRVCRKMTVPGDRVGWEPGHKGVWCERCTPTASRGRPPARNGNGEASHPAHTGNGYAPYVFYVGRPGDGGDRFLAELAAASGGKSQTIGLADTKRLTSAIRGLLTA